MVLISGEKQNGPSWVKIQDHGFKAKEILEDHYLLGGFGDDKIPDEIINPSRDYRNKLPSYVDIQNRNGLETMNCTVYGTENGIEIYEKTKYNEDNDYSERAPGIGAGTSRGGNSPHRVCEWIRNNGLFRGELLPFSANINTWNKYYSPKPLTQDFRDEGWKWLVIKEFKHRWLFRGGQSLNYKQQVLWNALLKCAPGVSVKAWKFRNGKYYKEIGESDNHWCTLIYGVWRNFWVVLDHYDNVIKTLEWDYDFMFAKQYYVHKFPPKYETQTEIETPEGKTLPKGTIISHNELVTTLWNFIVKTTGYIGLVFKKLGGLIK